MGNCMKRCKEREVVKEMHRQEDEKGNGKEYSGKSANESESPKGSVRVKLVLTKEQLECLIVQLKNSNGKKRFQDIFEEIERSREKEVAAWKPSLERIVEGSEMGDVDNQ